MSYIIWIVFINLWGLESASKRIVQIVPKLFSFDMLMKLDKTQCFWMFCQFLSLAIFTFMMWLIIGSTPIMIGKMESLQQELCEVCAVVLQANHVIQWISSSTHWYHGVFHIQATGTTTGQGFMEDLNGMDSSVPQSPTLSPWENRLTKNFTCSY